MTWSWEGNRKTLIFTDPLLCWHCPHILQTTVPELHRGQVTCPSSQELVGGGAREKTYSLCSFHSLRLSLGMLSASIYWLRRERPAELYRREPQARVQGESFGWLAWSPAVWGSANLPHGKPSCLPSSEQPLPWMVPHQLCLFAGTTSQWSTAILCFFPLCFPAPL